MKAIIALGNPGTRYERTPHNIGFAVIDRIAEELRLEEWKHSGKFKSEIIDIQHPERAIIAKPQTFMNSSGDAAKAIAGMYGILPEDLWVIHDEIDLAFGTVRHSFDSRSAGHNGVQSIIDNIGTKAFHRIRIGIKPLQDSRIPAEEYVVHPLAATEWKEFVQNVTPVVLDVLTSHGLLPSH